MAKVVLVDNLNRETESDVLLKENVTEEEAEKLADNYNKSHGPHSVRFAIVKDDDYKLWGGMAEFV